MADSESVKTEEKAAPRGTARPRVEADNGPRRSITLPLNEAGVPNWGKLTEKNLEVWKGLLGDPETWKFLGVTPPAPAAPSVVVIQPKFSSKHIKAGAGAISRFFAMKVSKSAGVPYELVLEAASLDEKELSEVAPVAVELANFIAGEFLARWGGNDVFDKYGGPLVLAYALGVLVKRKSDLVAKVVAEYRGEHPETVPVKDAEFVQ